jgi:hypothetical protein
MTVGIVSDTHSYFHPALAEVFDDVDLILHAGDLGTLDVLDALEAIAPTKAVWGNIDGWDIRRHVPEHHRLTLDGLDVWMKHIAGRPGRWQDDMGWRLAQDTPDVFICGHSHILRVERVDDLGGMLFVNPGAAGQHGFHQEKTCLRLHIEGGTAREMEVVHLDRDE